MHGLSGLGIIRMMPHLYKGKNIDREGVMSWHGLDALEIIEPAGLAVEFDGDHHGYLPARIKVARQQLNLIGADYEK
jgi:diacylglycerol kinase family enzyme